MQTSGKGACSYFPECSLSSTKTMQGECNSKTGKRSFTGLDTAEPKLVFYKDNVIFITTQTKPSIISFFHNKLSIKVYARCVFVESTVRIWHHSNTQPLSLPVPPRDILPNEQPCRRQLKKIPFRSYMIQKKCNFAAIPVHAESQRPQHATTQVEKTSVTVHSTRACGGIGRRARLSLPPGVLFSHHTFINIHARIH